MTTKLTLSIDEDKIKKIKHYSKEKGISVSKLFEQHILDLTNKKNKENLDISAIRGAFGKEPKNFDWKKVKTEYLVKKYVK